MQSPRNLTKVIAIAAMFSAFSAAAATDAPVPRSAGAVRRIVAMETERMLRPSATFAGNPAAMACLSDSALSAFGARGELLRQSQAAVLQEGTGRTLGIVEASSFMPISPTVTVWGEASFTTGSIRSVKWNNSADYELVAPYVFGDSVGGDLTVRSYHFAGGYAGTHGLWGWGAEASYTASIDYRNRDPRDKIVVSDLTVSLGGTRHAGSRYLVGVGGSFRVYNQESDVDFYNPNNDIRAYAFTGLGNSYIRFSGTSSLNTAYKGLGASAGLQLMPRKGSGLQINLQFSYIGIGQVLRDFNNLELTKSKTYGTTLFAAYSMRTESVLFAPQLTASFSRRLGFENLFGSSVGNNYLLIGTRRNYYADHADACAALPLEAAVSGRLSLHVNPRVALHYSHQDYRSPNRALEALGVTPAVTAGARWRAGAGNLLRLNAGVARRINCSDRSKLPGLNPDSGITQMLISDFHMLTTGRTDLRINAEYDHDIESSIALYVAVTYHRSWTGRCATSDGAILSVGAKF